MRDSAFSVGPLIALVGLWEESLCPAALRHPIHPLAIGRGAGPCLERRCHTLDAGDRGAVGAARLRFGLLLGVLLDGALPTLLAALVRILAGPWAPVPTKRPSLATTARSRFTRNSLVTVRVPR